MNDKQEQLQSAISDHERGEFEGYVSSHSREAGFKQLQRFTMLIANCPLEEMVEWDPEYPPLGYRGLFLHINERGNCALYMQFKNGNRREIASCV